MMAAIEVREALAALRLNQEEAASLLGVAPRSVRRWLQGEVIPGPAEAALRAWLKLDERGLAWRPDSVTLFEHDSEKIAVYRHEAMKLNELLERVNARGGPRLPWKINIAEGQATMEWASLSFYKLRNGGFSPATYRRSDQDASPDLERDRDLIEDGLYCIATAFEKCKRRAGAVRAVAAYVREHPMVGVRGAPMLGVDEKQECIRNIEGQADRLEMLAAQTELGDKTTYAQFKKINDAIAQSGGSMDRALLSEVARSFFEGTAKVRVIFLRPGRLDGAITWSKEYAIDEANKIVGGHRLVLMGERLRPISGSSHEFSDPQHVVVHVPEGVEFQGVDRAGYYVVADLHPAQVRQ
jgi:transcriptional regulator with XRE-family HTH domain